MAFVYTSLPLRTFSLKLPGSYNRKKMIKVEKISELTTNRLSVYLRCLNRLAAQDIKTISSDGLAKRFHLNSAQIRKDLAYFGEFGVRGVGYYVDDLRSHLTKILGLDKPRRAAIVGAGRLGTALSDYHGFKESNFSVVALFDTDKKKIGQTVGDVGIYDLSRLGEIVKEKQIDIVIIAVPAQYAQEVLELTTQAGVKAVLNFAPVPLKIADNTKLKNVDLTISLESLSYFLGQSSLEQAEAGESASTNQKKLKALGKEQGK